VRAKNEDAPYIYFVEKLTSEPMHMMHQGIGQIAVPFFFLVSGFVVTPIALRQGQGRFMANRLIRVYAPVLFVVTLSVLLILANLNAPSTGQSQEINPLNLFTNVTLTNYLIFPQVVLVPVAWTMIVEVIFYAMLLLMLPVFRRSVWLAISIEITFVFVVLMTRAELNETWSLFAVNASYLPIMIIGQIVWATTTKKIPLWAGSAFGAMAWSLYVLADIIDVGRIDDSYNLALAFAVICFLMGLFAEPKLKQHRVWTALSERSYSLYLLHMLVTFVVLDLLRPQVPFAIAVIIAVAATFGVVELSYRFVEKPSHSLARRLSRPRKPPAVDEPAVEAESAEELTVELERVLAPEPEPPSAGGRQEARPRSEDLPRPSDGPRSGERPRRDEGPRRGERPPPGEGPQPGGRRRRDDGPHPATRSRREEAPRQAGHARSQPEEPPRTGGRRRPEDAPRRGHGDAPATPRRPRPPSQPRTGNVPDPSSRPLPQRGGYPPRPPRHVDNRADTHRPAPHQEPGPRGSRRA